MDKNFQTIVIGLGAMGSAISYQLAKRRIKVLGIDQFSPLYMYGSSHGEIRVTRQAIGEGEEYVPLVLRSYGIWEEIEKATGKQILTITGGLIMTSVNEAIHQGSHFLTRQWPAQKNTLSLISCWMSSKSKKRFRQFKLKGNEKGYFEDKAGYLRPELAIEAQLELAQRYGAQLVFNEKVLDISAHAEHTNVETTKGKYYAEKVSYQPVPG